MPSRRAVCLLLTLALCLPCLPATAQDAPPHEGEGYGRQAGPKSRPAPKPGAKKSPAPAPATGKKAAAPARKVSKGPAVKNDGKPYLRSVDKNHDGRVSREEYLAGTQKRFSKADANHDGAVSPQEAKAAKVQAVQQKARHDAKLRAQGRPVIRKTRSDRPAKPALSTFDKNHDGRVSQKEYLARREKKFSEMDLNHDGNISREEARIAKQKLLERREERKAQAKERRLRKIEEAKLKSRQAAGTVSSSGPELIAPASPPPPAPPVQQAPSDAPFTPIAPDLPAQPTPET